MATAPQQQRIDTNKMHAPGMLNIWTEEARAQSAGDIDKRENLSRKEFLNEYVLKNRPVVLKDACKDWKAIGKWTPQFFKENYGTRTVPVFERKRAVTVRDKILMQDYVEEITTSSSDQRAKYLFSLKIPKEFPELLGDLEPRPTYWDPNWLASKYLLPGLPNFKLRNVTGLEMNIAGTASLFPFLHYDDLWTQTFITQVYGRKDWVIYPPDQTPYMYASKEAENVSQIPMEDEIDMGKFPMFANAKPIRFVLEQGEMLYGAPGWWHTTRSLTPSIAVVLSTANGPIWSQVTSASFMRAWQSPKWYAKFAALPISAYMTAFRAVKSATDPF